MSDTITTEPTTSPAQAGQALGLFYGQLAGLLKAGMPLPAALRTLGKEAGKPRFKAAVERAAAAIEAGTPPEQAFRAEGNELGGMLGRIAAAGAASGKLAPLLAELSAWTLAQDRIRRRMIDALLYPYITLLLASTLTGGLMLWLLSTDWGNFHEFNEFSPGTAFNYQSTVIAMCAVSFSILAMAVALPILSVLSRMSQPIRRWHERILVSFPVIGGVCRPMALARFCGAVSILLKAELPFHQAIAAGGMLSGFAPYDEATRAAAEALEKGSSHDEAWPDGKLFPPSLRFVLSSAEKRGEVPQAFAELAELYQLETESRAQLLMIVAPPACLVFVGAMVGAFLYSMTAPLTEALKVISG